MRIIWKHKHFKLITAKIVIFSEKARWELRANNNIIMTRDEILENYNQMIWKLVNTRFFSFCSSDKDDFVQILRMHLDSKYEIICEKSKNQENVLATYIYTILINKINDIYYEVNRRNANYPYSLNIVRWGSKEEWIDTIKDCSYEMFEKHENVFESISIVSSTMSERNKSIIELKIVEGFSSRKIANEIGVTKTTVQRIINKFINEVKNNV